MFFFFILIKDKIKNLFSYITITQFYVKCNSLIEIMLYETFIILRSISYKMVLVIPNLVTTTFEVARRHFRLRLTHRPLCLPSSRSSKNRLMDRVISVCVYVYVHVHVCVMFVKTHKLKLIIGKASLIFFYT